MSSQRDAPWPELPWPDVIDCVSRCVFRIIAGHSAGTGFLVSLANEESGRQFAQIATAWHVVGDLVGTSDELTLISSSLEAHFSTPANQIGFYPLGDVRYDTALLVLQMEKRLFDEKELLPLFPSDAVLARGAEIGWLGFPGIVEPELCFFQGHISGYLNDPPTYLVDGVAINGVSGGPAFDNRCHVVGIVSEYRPNTLNEGRTLPGLVGLVPINAVRHWMENGLGARVLRRSDINTKERSK
jgi:Trypsin-like peptidase domain